MTKDEFYSGVRVYRDPDTGVSWFADSDSYEQIIYAFVDIDPEAKPGPEVLNRPKCPRWPLYLSEHITIPKVQVADPVVVLGSGEEVPLPTSIPYVVGGGDDQDTAQDLIPPSDAVRIYTELAGPALESMWIELLRAAALTRIRVSTVIWAWPEYTTGG